MENLSFLLACSFQIYVSFTDFWIHIPGNRKYMFMVQFLGIYLVKGAISRYGFFILGLLATS